MTPQDVVDAVGVLALGTLAVTTISVFAGLVGFLLRRKHK